MGLLEQLIKEVEERIELLQGNIDEYNEVYGDDFYAIDASGGNFDDAYELGYEHGELFKEYYMLKKFKKQLEGLK
ncbi:hypothetical protein NXG04_07405 [Klebsiella pneumoniae]|nr:hypothetical protein [Klebsiella pneumoniae]MDS7714379.1 hypothetical protein [Klebsiella pneumoniae]